MTYPSKPPTGLFDSISQFLIVMAGCLLLDVAVIWSIGCLISAWGIR